jgi:hypothetical protein
MINRALKDGLPLVENHSVDLKNIRFVKGGGIERISQF